MEDIKAYVVLHNDKFYKAYSKLGHARSGITHASSKWVVNPRTRIGKMEHDKSAFRIIMCVGQKEIEP